MKRIHIGLSVDDIAESTRFYSTLFGAGPSVQKDDYAKWMLDDPRVNFSISLHSDAPGGLHLGVQVETADELREITGRLTQAGIGARETPSVTCCYAKGDKTWTTDPRGIPWETFLTHGTSTTYGNDRLQPADTPLSDASQAASAGECCSSA